MSIVVRRARKDDARTIADYALMLFAQHHAFDPERFVRLTDVKGAEWFYGSQSEAKDAAVLVAELNRKVVGFAYLRYEEKNYMDLLENAVRLHDIYVDEAVRGTGVGKGLMNAAIETAKGFGADKLVLSVAARNEHAREFFIRGGLRETMVEMTVNLKP
jgi:GNAT superfamily N-acetyltransferase